RSRERHHGGSRPLLARDAGRALRRRAAARARRERAARARLLARRAQRVGLAHSALRGGGTRMSWRDRIRDTLVPLALALECVRSGDVVGVAPFTCTPHTLCRGLAEHAQRAGLSKVRV